jgi:predicted HTH transcriptional regulator
MDEAIINTEITNWKKMETIEQIKDGDILVNISQSNDCISLPKTDVATLAKYIVASTNSNGKYLIIGDGHTEVIGVEPESFRTIFEQAKSQCDGIDVNLEFIPNIRKIYTVGVITVKP